MTESLVPVGTFNRIRWPDGAHAEEHSHWIGKMVEWYFDYGQTSYNVTHKNCEDGILVEKHVAKRGLGRTILKVIGCALKALSLLTIVLPLAMLIGKIIYRTNNKFVFKTITPNTPGGTTDPTPTSDPSSTVPNPIGTTGSQPSAPKRVLRSEGREVLLNEVLSKENLNSRIRQYDDRADDIFVDSFADLEKVRILYRQVNDQIIRVDALLEQERGLDPKEVIRLRRASNDLKAIVEKLKLKLNDDPSIKEIVKDLETRAKEQPSDENLNNYYKAVGILKDLSKIKESSAPFDVAFYKEVRASIMPTPIGNCGNSCYLNSDLQLILSIPGIKDLLLGDFRPLTVRKREDGESFEDYEAMLDGHRRNFEMTKKYLEHVKPAFQKFVKAVESKNQGKINAAARALRDATYEVGRKNLKKKESPFIKMIENGDQGKYEQMQPELFINIMLNAVGYSIRTRRYAYGDDAAKEELRVCQEEYTETMIQLPLREDGQDDVPIAHTMQGLVDHQFSPKSMNEGDWVINGKSVKKDVTLLQEAPEYLFVQIKRFGTNFATEEQYKLSDSIIFDDGEQVDFSKAMSKSVTDEDEGPFLYEVLGAIQHHGKGSGGGHYTALVKKGGEWAHCDDGSPVDTSFGKNYPVMESSGEPNLEKGYIFAFRRVPKGTEIIG